MALFHGVPMSHLGAMYYGPISCCRPKVTFGMHGLEPYFMLSQGHICDAWPYSMLSQGDIKGMGTLLSKADNIL